MGRRMQNVGVMWPLCGGGMLAAHGRPAVADWRVGWVLGGRVRMERRASSWVIRSRALQRCGDGGKTEADLACPDLAPITNRPADELALHQSWRQPRSACRRRCPRAQVSLFLAQATAVGWGSRGRDRGERDRGAGRGI